MTMTYKNNRKLACHTDDRLIWQQAKCGRREFLKKTAAVSIALSAGFNLKSTWSASKKTRTTKKRVIVIGIDGMDP